MGGAHVERESRYEATGMTESERNQLIWTLSRRGWTQAKIAARVGVTQQGVSYALQRMMGKPPRSVRYEMCDACGLNFPRNQIDGWGLCPSCAE